MEVKNVFRSSALTVEYTLYVDMSYRLSILHHIRIHWHDRKKYFHQNLIIISQSQYFAAVNPIISAPSTFDTQSSLFCSSWHSTLFPRLSGLQTGHFKSLSDLTLDKELN